MVFAKSGYKRRIVYTAFKNGSGDLSSGYVEVEKIFGGEREDKTAESASAGLLYAATTQTASSPRSKLQSISRNECGKQRTQLLSGSDQRATTTITFS